MKYCRKGHAKTKDNVYISKKGYETCKICANMRYKKWINNNKKHRELYLIKWRKLHPWYVSFLGARARCNHPYAPGYERYGGKGIKFLMTFKEFEFMWYRDKASLMKRPSIDRINSKGNYELNNCQFIELSENSGKDKLGEKHHRTKLKDEQVREIRNLYFNKKMSEKEIIKKFSTSHGAVYSILKYQTWKHI